jgi:hypothetical protein
MAQGPTNPTVTVGKKIIQNLWIRHGVLHQTILLHHFPVSLASPRATCMLCLTPEGLCAPAPGSSIRSTAKKVKEIENVGVCFFLSGWRKWG